MSVEDRLNELGITLPAIPEPVGNYVAAVRTGNLLYLGGQGAVNAEGVYFSGKVGSSPEQAWEIPFVTMGSVNLEP